MRFALLMCALLCGRASALGAAPAADGVQQFADLGRCALESGKVIEPCRLGYRIYGDLDAHRDHVIMGLTWYAGTSGDLKMLFGAGKMVDTSSFAGLAVDAFGDGVSSSPSISSTQHGADFPAFTVRDMVAAEYRLAKEVLHLRRLYAVVGVSMGGMQVFEWTAAHPEFVGRAVAIAGTPRQASYDLLHWRILADAIEADPGYMDGRYTIEPRLQLANRLGQLTGSSPGYVSRTIPAGGFDAFYTSAAGPSKLDANDRLWQTRAMIAQDVFRGRNEAEIKRAHAVPTLIAVSEIDETVNPAEALTWAVQAKATIFRVPGDCGHKVMECGGSGLVQAVRTFLEP